MSRAIWRGLIASALVMVGGGIAFVAQWQRGLELTALENSYTWGLYIAGLAFFVGNAAGGLVLSASIYVFGVRRLKPFARLGALTAFANVTAAMLIVVPDLGRADRILNLLRHPNFVSPLVWDVVVLSVYAVLAAGYLLVLMLPDLGDPIARWLPKTLDREAFSERWAKRLAPVALLFAIGIHVVTAWIFSTQRARVWWFSPALAPDFVAVAIAAGTSVVIVAAALSFGASERLQPAYATLAQLVLVATLIHFFLMFNDLFIHAWSGGAEADVLMRLTWGENALGHTLELLAPAAGALLMMSARVRARAWALASSAALLVGGVFVHRLLIMPPAMNAVPLSFEPFGGGEAWVMPIARGRFLEGASTFVSEVAYTPTLVEVAIFLGVGAYALFVVLLAIGRLPIVREELVDGR